VAPAPEVVGVGDVCVGADVVPLGAGGSVAGAVVVGGAGVVGSGTETGGIVGVEIVGRDSGRTTQLSAGAAADDATAPASARAPSTTTRAQAERIGWLERGAGGRDRIAGGRAMKLVLLHM
jgi:hypothetical protein